MQSSARKPKARSTKSKEVSSKDDLQPPASSRRPLEDLKIRKTSVASPRASTVTPKKYTLNTTAADIYSQNNKRTTINPLGAPKKPVTKVSALTKTSASPMKNLLSSPSSVSNRQPRIDSKASTPVLKKKQSNSTTNLAKNNSNLGPVNVTVNSPPVKRRLELRGDSGGPDVPVDSTTTRHRQKTRTLQEDEVVVLTPDAVDNNREMLKLTRTLKAKPKAFFVDLGDGDAEPKPPSQSSEDEVSYEDDFESYESDFESYHSGSESSVPASDDAVKTSTDSCDDLAKRSGSSENHVDDHAPISEDAGASSDEQRGYDSNEERSKKDEERMLDSGSYELRESQRSATRSKAVMLGLISEDREMSTSLADEGFQEMAGVPRKTDFDHVDVLDRPLFIDFRKSKELKRKRILCEHHRQRAKDLLAMITLHEMSYSLFEMKPIPYDLYMATFGRSNYVQTSSQTYDDGVNEETQTDEIFLSDKWTQYPVKFSNERVCLTDQRETRTCTKQEEDYLKRFTFLLNTKEVAKEGGDVSEEYLRNPLRVFFEQKDGAGGSSVLPKEDYEAKVKNADFSVVRMKRFLKKVEGKVSSILRNNIGDTFAEHVKPTDLPFSKGYTVLNHNNLTAFDCLENRKLTSIVFSDTKSNLLLTVHEKNAEQLSMERALVCLWDINVASGRPLKILVAIESITVCRFRGNTDGIFVSALEDGSIHLWDLSEDATITKDVGSSETLLFEFKTGMDRVTNVKNSNVEFDTKPVFLQACAYTTSAANLAGSESIDNIVGLELLGNDNKIDREGGRKIVGQVCSLQSIGVLTIWVIVQEKESKSSDPGKALWSKLKLERNQNILLSQYVDLPTHQCIDYKFNLTSARRRLLTKKQDKRDTFRLKSAASRQSSAANVRRQKSTSNLTENKMADKWDAGLLCTDLKVCKYNNVDVFLISKSCGEVLICTRVGAVKIDRILVSTDSSLITTLAASPQGLPYFLAASEAGAVSLCSLAEMRVLLTLDTRNAHLGRQSARERYQHDHKGRYIGTVAPKSESVDVADTHGDFTQCPISGVVWPHWAPCCIAAVSCGGACSVWQLTRSDIHACAGADDGDNLVAACAVARDTVALLMVSGEVRLHRQKTSTDIDQLDLFLKYVALL